MNQLKTGAILSYITIFLTVIIGVMLTPFIIQKLGDAEYGLYTLIGAFVGYISVLDFGLNNTIIRFVAKYRAEQSKTKEENFLAVTMIIYAIISVIIAIIGVVLYYHLECFFENSLTFEEIRKAKLMFSILIFNLVITLPGGSFNAICSGYENFVFPRVINILRYVFRSVLVVTLLFFGGDSISIVVLDTIMNILVIVVNAYYVFKKLKVVFKLHYFDTTLVKEIFSYSFWVFILALISELHWKSGQLVLGINTNTTLVAIYAVGILLGSYYGAFAGAIGGVFLPRATNMIVKNESGKQLTFMMIKIGRLSLLVSLLIIGGFLLYGRQFVFLWVGESYIDAWIVALVIMIGYTIPLIQSFANLTLSAKGLFSFKAISYIFFIGFGTFLGYLLIDKYSIIGMVSGITFGWFLAQLSMNIYYSKVINLHILLFFKETYKKIIPTFLLILLIGYSIDLIPGIGWLNLLLKISLFFIVYFLLMFFLGINQFEKEFFKKDLDILKKRLIK